MRRRDFLAATIATSASAVTARAWSAPASDQRFLLVFLRGAYDALNVVVPTSSDFYYEARPTLAIARPDALNPNAALPLDGDWGLHPALKDSLYPLWQKKQVAFVPFVGSADLSRSHFATQDIMELGLATGPSQGSRSGFLARLAQQLDGSTPVAFTAKPPLILQGPQVAPNIAVASITKPGVDERQTKLILNMYRDHPLRAAVAEGFTVRDRTYSAVADEMTAANRNAVSSSGFELTARRVARMMRTTYNIGFVDVGGWDTHVNQGATTGPLAGRIGQLGRGLAGMAEEMGPDIWSKATVVVISEFGRTFRENGDKGTDHGHGSIYWVLGGAVKGGRIAGEQVRLSPDTLNQGRDLPTLTDYRSFIGQLLARLYGLSPEQLENVFPGAPTRDLALV